MEFLKKVWDIIAVDNLPRLLIALVILIIGWILALVVKRMIAKVLRAAGISNKLRICVAEQDAGKTVFAEKVIAQVGFWCIFLLTVLMCFSVLKLDNALMPIRSFLNKIWGYLPNLIAGALLTFAAWLAASGVKYLTQLLTMRLNLDERIEKHCDTAGRDCELSGTIANVAGLLTWIFFLPAILRALKISGITAPLVNMLSKIMEYLPNLIAATVIVVAGLIVAAILRNLTVKLLSGMFLKGTAMPESWQAHTVRTAGIVVYALVALPVIAAALGALHIEVLAASTGNLVTRLLTAAGNIFGALLILIVAYLAGVFAAGIVRELLSGLGFNRIFHALGFCKEEKETQAPSIFAGRLVVAAAVLAGFIAAFELLGFTALAELIRTFLPFAGKILLAAAVFFLGIWLANFTVDAVKTHNGETKFLQVVIRYAILFFAGAVALHSTGIGSPIVLMAFTLILGAAAVAAAIAFGLGGKEIAAEKLKEWNNKKS